MSQRLTSRKKIKLRVRKKIGGNTEIPRVSVFRSNSEIYAQIVNDKTGHTLLSVSSIKMKDVKGKKSDVAKEVGIQLAKNAVEAGIKKVVFDRNGYLYHGRVKALAEGAREGGLEF